MNAWRTYYEIGVLVDHPEPADFANFMVVPECEHGESYHDDERCPEPCGQVHDRCSACHRPVGLCPLID